jgi:hypothetical protein
MPAAALTEGHKPVVHGDLTLATAERLRDYPVFIG